MFRRIWIALALSLVLPALCLGAEAAEGTGSIRVLLLREEAPVGGTVALSYVGHPAEGGYRLEEAFGGGMVRQEDAHSPYLAQWLGEMAGSDAAVRELDGDGYAAFDGLEEGLYLLVQQEAQEGYSCVKPFLMELPYEGQWNLTAYPKTQELTFASPATGQHPAPILGAMGMVLAGLGLAVCIGRRKKD